MGNGLFAGNMGSLRGNSFIFNRSVCFDRFALAAGHDRGGMTMSLSSSREIKISGKINFVRRKRALPFCRLCGAY